jgi:hypothetical protein
MKRFWAWILAFFEQEYEVTLWFDKAEDFAIKKESVSYRMKSVQKITDKELKGVEINGHLLHIKCIKPYDFRVRKLK